MPQIVKVLKLESYEDTLNNLVLKDNGDLFAKLNNGVKEDYLLRYMLDDQSRDSLLNTDVFRRPFNTRWPDGQRQTVSSTVLSNSPTQVQDSPPFSRVENSIICADRP